GPPLRPVKGGIAAGAQAGAQAFAALAVGRLVAGDAGAGASLPLGSLAAELALDQVLDLGPSRFELKHGLSEFDERIDPSFIGASAGGLPGRVVDGPDRCPAGSVGVRAQGGEGVPCSLESFFAHVDHALDDGHKAAPDLLG